MAVETRMTPQDANVALANGIVVSKSVKIAVDWESIRRLVESGVPIDEVAALFKINRTEIYPRSKREQWMTPLRVEKLRKEIAKLQKETYEQTGVTKSLVELKAMLWQERGERWKEKQAEIIEKALDGISDEAAKALILESKDLKTIVELARLLTGEAKAEETVGPKLAINIGLLRSGNAPRPVSPVVEAEEV